MSTDNNEFSPEFVEHLKALKARQDALGGFENSVLRTEAARKATEARGYEVKPESFQANRYESERERLDAIAQSPTWTAPPELWAYFFGVELAERNGAGEDFRDATDREIMRTFEALAETLPLRQATSGLPWPKGEQLPPRWSNGLFLRKEELREWAKEHCPDLLGSALLAASPTDAGTPPAGDDATETPEARRLRLQARCNELKSSGVRAWQKQVAVEENISTTRLKAILACGVATTPKPAENRFASLAAYGKPGK